MRLARVALDERPPTSKIALWPNGGIRPKATIYRPGAAAPSLPKAESRRWASALHFRAAAAEENILFTHDQQRAWLPLVERLAETRRADFTEAERELAPTVAQLNDLFRPAVERTPTLRWLGVARDDGLRFFVLARAGAGRASPRLENRVAGPDLEQPVLELSWSGGSDAHPRAKWSGHARDLPNDAGFLGHVPAIDAWFAASRSSTPRVAWMRPYLATSTPEPSALASIVWNHRSYRYVLAIALALTDIPKIISELGDARWRVLVTTRDHRVLGLPEPEPAFRALAPVRELRENAFEAALAVEPPGHRTLWPFRSSDRTRWAGRTFIDRSYPALAIYALQAHDD